MTKIVKFPTAHERQSLHTQRTHERVADLLNEAASLLESDGRTQERAWLELATITKHVWQKVKG